jgi:hypothetical protein
MRGRFAQWMRAINDNGYHALRLSDVHQRFLMGVGLPDQTVVLVFDPGYRHTFETLAPILRRYRIPALWVIDRAGLGRGGRRYIHLHEAGSMQQSDYWDVAFHPIRNLWAPRPESSPVIVLQTMKTRWANEAGKSALNVGPELQELNGLHVGTTWSGKDLANRLAMEWPLQAPAYLTVRPIAQTFWGVVSAEPQKTQFALNAPLYGRGGSLFWLGTRGCTDFELTAQARSFFGEWIIWLRSTGKQNAGIAVGLSSGKLTVDLKSDSGRFHLASVPIKVSGLEPTKLSIRLIQNNLQIFIQGREILHLANIPASETPGGIVRMTVYDKVRGAARVDMERFVITPLLRQ